MYGLRHKSTLTVLLTLTIHIGNMIDSRTDEEREEEAKIEVGFTATEETTEDDFKLNIIHKEEDEDCESCSA